MTERFRYSTIRPVDFGSLDIEPFHEYLVRIQEILPNFPPNVLEHWVYRHYDDAVRAYSWLGFRRLQFEKKKWTTETILGQVQARRPQLIEGWKIGLLTKAGFCRSKLGVYMIEHGTWPAPPLVLDNTQMRIKHPKDETVHPHHLIEGHHRLAYLHALHESAVWSAKPLHDIWLVTRT